MFQLYKIMNTGKTISFVIPVYNEEKNIELLYQSLVKILQKDSRFEYELIFVNDGSTDDSWNLIKNFSSCLVSIKALNFSKNYGHQIALTAGYHHARGDAIISMDADMQHPPEIIPSMIQAWLNGFEIVYVRNKNRNDNFFKKIASLGYYRLLELISELKIPRNVADFRLIDQKVLLVLNQCKEKSPYLRGLVAWTGFNYTILPCTFAQRHAGIPGYTWKKMFKLALDGIIGFSIPPFFLMNLISRALMLTFLSSALYLIAFCQSYFFALWSILVSSFFLLSIQSVLVMLVERTIKHFHQSKKRPLYVISTSINC